MTHDTHIEHFLITYDVTRERAEVESCGDDYERALERYEALEKDIEGLADLEVVLLSADSIETVMRTHSSYFSASRQSLEKFLPDGVLV